MFLVNKAFPHKENKREVSYEIAVEHDCTVLPSNRTYKPFSIQVLVRYLQYSHSKIGFRHRKDTDRQ